MSEDFHAFVWQFKPPLTEDQVRKIVEEHKRILKIELEKQKQELTK